MGVVNIIGKRDNPSKYKNVIDTTLHSKGWGRGLSPFFVGPVQLYDGYTSKNVENAWQFSKVYPQFVDKGGDIIDAYLGWAIKGWCDSYAHRYPMGKGVKPLFSYWDGKRLSYIESRKKIYIPLYAKSVAQTNAFYQLKALYEKEGEVTLVDFDGYDFKKLGMTINDVINTPFRKMGHAFVLGMLLKGSKAVLVNEV